MVYCDCPDEPLRPVDFTSAEFNRTDAERHNRREILRGVFHARGYSWRSWRVWLALLVLNTLIIAAVMMTPHLLGWNRDFWTVSIVISIASSLTTMLSTFVLQTRFENGWLLWMLGPPNQEQASKVVQLYDDLDRQFDVVSDSAHHDKENSVPTV